jgi:hypothetical protein
VRIYQRAVCDFNRLFGKIGIELSRSTLWTEERVKRGLIPDTEAIKHTTVSISFNIEISDSFCGYVRLFHLEITVRTMALTHRLTLVVAGELSKN